MATGLGNVPGLFVSAPETRALLAGFWRRLLGYLIDGFLLAAVSLLLGRPGAWLSVLLSAAYWTFFVGYHDHATIGMRVLGMRVTPADGRPGVTYVDALVRWLMMIVGGAAFALGFLWAAWDPRRQAWHDKVARTLVVLT